MKRLFIIALLGVTALFAENQQAGCQEPQFQDEAYDGFNEIKPREMQIMRQLQECVEASTNTADLKICNEFMQSGLEELKQLENNGGQIPYNNSTAPSTMQEGNQL